MSGMSIVDPQSQRARRHDQLRAPTAEILEFFGLQIGVAVICVDA
jgi:hypothetical protein